MRPIVVAALRLAFTGSKTHLILQNADDLNLLTAAKVASAEQMRLICGAGVDTQAFKPEPERDGLPLIVLPARMLWGKRDCGVRGVRDGSKAARIERALCALGDPDSTIRNACRRRS